MTKSEVGKYRLKFMLEALEEWNALDGGANGPLRKALKKQLEQPRVIISPFSALQFCSTDFVYGRVLACSGVYKKSIFTIR